VYPSFSFSLCSSAVLFLLIWQAGMNSTKREKMRLPYYKNIKYSDLWVGYRVWHNWLSSL
jgi:hypothetical protein